MDVAGICPRAAHAPQPGHPPPPPPVEELPLPKLAEAPKPTIQVPKPVKPKPKPQPPKPVEKKPEPPKQQPAGGMFDVGATKQTDLVMIPLRMALWQRGREGHPARPGELIHHSDAGSQYTSIRYTEHLALEQIRPSIGTVGDAYDNALMESINGLFKSECIRTTVFHDGPYKDHRRRRVRHRRLGRLVQQQAPAQ